MRIWDKIEINQVRITEGNSHHAMQRAIDAIAKWTKAKEEDSLPIDFINPQNILIGKLISAIVTLEDKVDELEQQLNHIGRNP
jgi:hypothetical protein